MNYLLDSRFLKKAALAAVIAYPIQHASAAVIPIANGGFETTGSSPYSYSSSPEPVVDWNFTNSGGAGGAVCVGLAAGGAPAGLGLSVSNTGNAAFFYQGAATLSQTLTGYTLTPGATYNLTLDVGRRYDGTTEALTVELFAGATALTLVPTGANLSPTGPSSPQAWSFSYVAPATPATGDLTIELVGNAGTDLIAFDNINLTETPLATPEPSTAVLMVFGGLGMCLWQRRRLAREI